MNCSTQVLLSTMSAMDTTSAFGQPPLLDALVQEEAIIIEEISKPLLSSTSETNNRNNFHSNSTLYSQQNNMAVAEVDSSQRTEPEVTLENEMISTKYPVALKHDNDMGRCLVAARDIEPGEVILEDWPILMAPNATEDSSTTCLGCCLIIQEPEACPRCGWQVCSEKCSNIPQHAEFECKVFARENIKPDFASPFSLINAAEYIKILRCLLLKDESCPEKMAKWKQVKSLEAHIEIRRNIPKVYAMSGLVKRFVRNICKLDQYDETTIDFVLGVVDVNAFRHSLAPEPLKKPKHTEQIDQSVFRNATFLYPMASMAAHGCIRNTDWKTLAGGHLEMWASVKIPKGDLITHAYVDLLLGTPERRKTLRSLFYFDCTCARCCDNTELGTNFSSLKCPTCKTGYLLTETALAYNSDWVCNNEECKERKSYKYERELVQQIKSEEKSVCDQIPMNASILVSIKSLMSILKKHRDVTVHPNHYTLVNIEFLLVRYLLQLEKPAVTIVREMKRLINKHMQISTNFHPCSTDKL